MLKKAFSLLLSVCMLLGVVLSPAALNADVEVDIGDISQTTNLGGDVNGDKTVDLKDVLLLFRYCVDGTAESFNYRAADCNGDTYIDLNDAVYLAQSLAGWQDRSLSYSTAKFTAGIESGTNAGYVQNGTETFKAVAYAGNTFLGWYDLSGSLRYSTPEIFQEQLLCNVVAKFKDNNILTSIGGGYEQQSTAPVVYTEKSENLPQDTPYFWAKNNWGSKLSTVAYSGNKGFSVQFRYQDSYIHVPNLEKNTEYAVSFKIKLDSEEAFFKGMLATDASVIKFTDAQKQNIGGFETQILGGDSWNEVSFHFNTGDKTAVNLVYYYSAANADGDKYNWMHIDELTMYKMEKQDSYKQYNVTASAENGQAYTNLLAGQTTAYAGSRIVFTSAPTNHDAQFLGWYNGQEKISSERVLTVENLSENLNYTAKYTTGTTAEDTETAEKITKALQEDGWYTPLFEKAIHNNGNRALLAKMVQKAQKGEDITIVGLGGSITMGAGTGAESTRYINKVGAYLEKALGVKVNVINAGIGATSSLLGKGRMQEHVLKYNPDLVIVDFTTNDQSQEVRYAYSYEALIRTLAEKQIATVAVMFGPVNNDKYKTGVCERTTNAEKLHWATLQYYNVPIVNYFDAMWDYLDSNGDGVSDEKDIAQWTTLWADYIHPSTAGHALAAGAISYYLQTVIDNVNIINTTVPSVPTEFLYDTTENYFKVTMYTSENIGSKQTAAQGVKIGFYGNKDANTIYNWKPWVIEKDGYLELQFNSLKSLTLMHIQGAATVKDVGGITDNNLTLASSAVRVLVNGKPVLADDPSNSGSALNWASSTYFCNETGPVTIRIECVKGTYCMTSILVGE